LKERALTRDQLLYVFTQIADTLEETHRAGIIHRDLKPDNVYLVRDPSSRNDTGPPLFVKLLDFGVAKVLGAAESNLTQSGVILGTPYYMAPEQARGQTIDFRADMYSFGVMMFHAFTGRLPFIADSAVAVLTAHAIEPPPLPSQVSSVDPAVERVILRCMEKRPADRFGSMREIAHELRNLRRLAGGHVLPPAQESSAFPRLDTEAGASLSGPYAGVTGSSQALSQVAPTSTRAVVFAIGAVGMLILGGLAAVALIVRHAPAPASSSSLTVASESPRVAATSASTPLVSQPTAAETAVAASAPVPSASATPSSLAATAPEPAKPAMPPPYVVGRKPNPPATATAVTAPISPELVNPFHH